MAQQKPQLQDLSIELRQAVDLGLFHVYGVVFSEIESFYGLDTALKTSKSIGGIQAINSPSRDDAAVAADSFAFDCPVLVM